MTLSVEVDREDDGRPIARVPELPGVLAYGRTREEATDRAWALALRVLADRIEHGEPVPGMDAVPADQQQAGWASPTPSTRRGRRAVPILRDHPRRGR